MMDLVPVLNPSYVFERSPKYRRLLNEVLEYFSTHPDVNIVKVVFDTGMRAESAAVKCRLHLRRNENLKIVRRRNEVFFIRGDSL